MIRYLVTDNDLRDAITEAIDSQDKDPQGYNYVINSPTSVVSHVLRLLDRHKVAEAEQTENSKQNSHREIDTSEYPFIRLEANELVGMICDAYLNGLSDKKQS